MASSWLRQDNRPHPTRGRSWVPAGRSGERAPQRPVGSGVRDSKLVWLAWAPPSAPLGWKTEAQEGGGVQLVPAPPSVWERGRLRRRSQQAPRGPLWGWALWRTQGPGRPDPLSLPKQPQLFPVLPALASRNSGGGALGWPGQCAPAPRNPRGSERSWREGRALWALCSPAGVHLSCQIPNVALDRLPVRKGWAAPREEPGTRTPTQPLPD